MTALRRGENMEATLARLLGSDYRRPAEDGDRGIDLETREEPRRIIEVKAALQSLRDVHAAIVRLAILAAKRKDVRATLIAWVPTMRADRLRAEWGAACSALRPDVAKRLSLVAITADGDLALPSADPELRRLLASAHEALRDAPEPQGRPAASWSQRSYAIWRVLFDAWLRGERPLAMKEVGRRAGASQPIVRLTVERLLATGELDRARNRRVSFRGVPRRSLAEVAVIADRFRRTSSLVDASGRPAEAATLLRRIERHAPDDVALGGVIAARHYHPGFDLNGVPRIDITVPGLADVRWMERVDPALRPGRPGEPGAIVIHRNLEAAPGFAHDGTLRRPVTGPTEVLLDLMDLRLIDQAEALIRHLRPS
jgi:hypothetical protein